MSWEFETAGANDASKSSNFKGETQHYVVKLPKSAGAGQYCPKIPRVPATLGTRANSSPERKPNFPYLCAKKNLLFSNGEKSGLVTLALFTW